MRPYLYPAIIVAVIVFFINGWFCAIGFGLATYYYGKWQYCAEVRKNKKLLQEVRAASLTSARTNNILVGSRRR